MTSPQPLKLGYICGFSTHSPFWTIVEHGVRQGARELGAALTIRFCADEPEMIAAIQDLTRQRFGAIMLPSR
jgi:ABC-type sugar transport system substrate-binding protein